MASAAAARPLASVGRNQIMDSKYVERPVEGLRTAVRFRPAPPAKENATQSDRVAFSFAALKSAESNRRPQGRRARGFAKHCFAPLRATSAAREARVRHIPPGSNTKSRFAATRQPSAPVPPPYSCCARCSSWRRQSSVWNQPAHQESAHKVRGLTADLSRMKPAPTAGR